MKQHVVSIFVGTNRAKLSEARAALLENLVQERQVSNIVETLPPSAFLGPLREGDLDTFYSFIVSPSGVVGPLADIKIETIAEMAKIFGVSCHQLLIMPEAGSSAGAI